MEAWGVCIWGIDAVAATVPQGRCTGWKGAESYREAGLFLWEMWQAVTPAPGQSQTEIARTDAKAETAVLWPPRAKS